LGIGYEFSKKFSVHAEYNAGNDVDLLPKNSRYSYDFSNFSSYQIAGRYKFLDDFYASLGGGWTNVLVDSLYDRTNDTYVDGTGEKFPSAFAAIGFSSNVGFVELRHTVGFSKFIFQDGEESRFETTSSHFGFNFHL
jgi:hypothetical protein